MVYPSTRTGLTLSLLLLLAACGRQTSGISGTVTSPTGNVAGTFVAACASNACDPETDGSAAYTIPVTAGQFAVIAVQDTNGDGALSSGDYGGGYPEAVTAPAAGIDITLQPLTASSALNSSPSKKVAERFLRR